jgi:hypothetical protein
MSILGWSLATRGWLTTVTSPGSPGSLEHLAHRVENTADLLRARAGALLAAASSARWQSSAADAFRRRVETMATSQRHAAAVLDDAAAALREHAATVRRNEQLLGDAARVAWQAGAEVGARLASWSGELASALGL